MNDIETGAFELADESPVAAKKLLVRVPDAQIFGIRIGHLAVLKRRQSVSIEAVEQIIEQ